MTQAMRFNKGKPKLSFLLEAPHAIEAYSRVCEAGMEMRGYPRGNWKKGLPYTELVDSTMRHLKDFMNRKEVDDGADGTNLPNIYLAMWNIVALVEMIHTHPELDDRSNPLTDKIRVSGSQVITPEDL